MVSFAGYLAMALLVTVLVLLIEDTAVSNSQISEWSYGLKCWLQKRREREKFRKRMNATLRRNRRINPELWGEDKRQ